MVGSPHTWCLGQHWWVPGGGFSLLKDIVQLTGCSVCIVSLQRMETDSEIETVRCPFMETFVVNLDLVVTQILLGFG